MRMTDSAMSIAKVLKREGAMSSTELIAIMSVGIRANRIQQTIKSMKNNGQLILQDDKLHLSDEVMDVLESQEKRNLARGDLVPSRTAPKFKPLNPAYLPKLSGTRNDIEVRELHPITLASNVPHRRIDE